MSNPKSLIIKLAACFLGALLFLTFFSNTILTFNLPGVVVGSPTRGVVTSTHRSFGDVDFAEVAVLFAQDPGTIHFTVSPGDQITYGDILFTIEADRQELLDRLEDEQSRLETAIINLTSTRGDLIFEQTRLAQLTPESVHPITTIQHQPNITPFEHEARRLQTEIQRAQTDHQANITLFAAGGISQSQLNDSAHTLNQLQESYTLNNHEMNMILINHDLAISDARQLQQQAFETEQSNIIHRINTLGHTIQLLEIEETDRRRSLQRLYDQLEAGGIATIYAQHNGIVREIPQELENGMIVSRNQIVMRYAIAEGNEYLVVVEFPERIGSLPAGSTVRINIPVVHQRNIQGEVLRTTASGGRLRLEIAFETNVRINGGERAEVVLEQVSNFQEDAAIWVNPADTVDDEFVLPNSAIREDFAGSYVMFIEREANTLMGHSYYARQARISVLDEGDRYTLFTTMDYIEGPVIITSDRPFWQGSRVRIVDDR